MSMYNNITSFCNSDNIDKNTLSSMVKIELSGLCNLKCVFCCKKPRGRLLTIEDINLIYNKIEEFNYKYKSIKEIGLFNLGESALNSNLKYASKLFNKYRIFLTTNGTIDISDVVEYIDSLKVSWNYKNVDDFIAKTGSTKEIYNKIINNIDVLYKSCVKHNKRLSISTIINNLDEQYDYIDALKTLIYHEHFFIPLQKQIDVIDGERGIRGTIDNKKQDKCWSLFKGIYIDCNLQVKTCDYAHSNQHILGSLYTMSLEQCVFSEKAKRMKQCWLDNKIPEECKECWS